MTRTLRDEINATIARHITAEPNGVSFDGAADDILAAVREALLSLYGPNELPSEEATLHEIITAALDAIMEPPPESA